MTDWIIPDWPAPPRVRALVTTRGGGVSAGPFAALNLADHVGDDRAAVNTNRSILAEHLPDDPRWLTQVHGNACVRADGLGVPGAADASWTDVPGVVCAVLTADCLPVLLCDRSGTAVAAVHAGWRGLAAGVIENAVRTMGRAPEGLIAWLGPAIGRTAFEVGPEVRGAFIERNGEDGAAFVPGRGDRWMCDIYALARHRLARAGVGPVFGGTFCTVAEAERFFSYRRDGVTGRMAALIWLERAEANGTGTGG